jgi:hypothetical protein
MKRAYPDKQNIQLVVCDQIRQEAFSKVSILGWYIGEEIVMLPKAGERTVKPPFRMGSLGFLFVIKDSVGEFDASFSILSPKKEALVKPTKLGRQKLTGKTHTIGVQSNTPEFKMTGQYSVVLVLDQKRYEFPLKIGTKSMKDALAAMKP